MKTLKVIGLAVISIFLMVGGLVFAASFAVEELQSWPKALMEARGVVYGQIALALTLEMAKGKWKRRAWRLSGAFMIVSFIGYTWALSASPLSRHWLCLWGMFSYASIGGIIFGKFLEECSPPRGQAPAGRPADPSLN